MSISFHLERLNLALSCMYQSYAHSPVVVAGEHRSDVFFFFAVLLSVFAYFQKGRFVHLKVVCVFLAWVIVCLVVSTSANEWLERLVSEVTCDALIQWNVDLNHKRQAKTVKTVRRHTSEKSQIYIKASVQRLERFLAHEHTPWAWTIAASYQQQLCWWRYRRVDTDRRRSNAASFRRHSVW